METKPKIEIIIALAVMLVVFVYFAFQGSEFFVFNNDPIPLDLEIPNDDFTRFALLVTFAYDAMPTIAQQFSVSAITVQLLLTGFSPLLLAVISALGLLTGQMILYGVGMFVRKIHKGSFGDIAGKHHFLHKYHFLIYFMIPFVGILGDGAMLYSGHQRINPLRIIPFLFVADLASTARWILPMQGELALGNHLQ